MKWYEISKIRPPHGELIWVWDKSTNSKFLIRYMGCEDSWIRCKDNDKFPIWAYLNNQPERSKREDLERGCGALNPMET